MKVDRCDYCGERPADRVTQEGALACTVCARRYDDRARSAPERLDRRAAYQRRTRGDEMRAYMEVEEPGHYE